MNRYRWMIVAAAFIMAGCGKNDTPKDETPPVIDLSVDGAFPVQCSELVRGQTFTFKARFTDNVELGSYGLDIHHNFDQHSHSTETATCEAEGVKTSVNPFLLVRNYTIPSGNRSFEATASVEVPADVDPGDYHFMVKLTDKQGWQTLRGLSIKIR